MSAVIVCGIFANFLDLIEFQRSFMLNAEFFECLRMLILISREFGLNPVLPAD